MGVSTGQKLLAPGWAVGGLFGGGRALAPEPRAWLLPLHPWVEAASFSVASFPMDRPLWVSLPVLVSVL